MRKFNKEKFENFIITVVGIIVLAVIIKTPWRKPTTWEYHEFLANGGTWQEWIERGE